MAFPFFTLVGRSLLVAEMHGFHHCVLGHRGKGLQSQIALLHGQAIFMIKVSYLCGLT